MPTSLRTYLFSLLNLQPGEGGLVALALLYAFLVAMAETLAYTAGYALFLGRFHAQLLPYTYIGGSIFATLVSFLYLKGSERFDLSTMIISVLAFLALVLLGYRIGLGLLNAGWLVFSLPIYHGMARILGYALLWNLLGRLFNLQEGKRLFGLLGSGKDLAGVVLGFCTPLLVARLHTVNLLWVALAALVIAIGVYISIERMYSTRFVLRTPKPTALLPETPPAAGERWRLDRYIWLMSGFYILWVFGNSFIINIFYTQVERQYSNADQLAAFIGLFFGIAGVLGLFMRIFLTSRVLNHFRLGTVLMVTPVLLTLCMGMFVLTGTFSSVAIMLVGVPVLANLLANTLDSIGTPAFNVLYQPLSPHQRTRVQTTIDGILYPVSVGIVGVVLLLLTTIWQWSAVQVGSVLVILLVGWVVTAALLGREYPRKLRQAVANHTLQRADLTRLDASSFAILQESLASPHAGVALYALDLIEAVAPSSLPSVLPALLEHRERVVRLEALRRVEELGLRAIAPTVRARLQAEGSLAVQGASLRTLAVLGDAQLLDEIIPYLDHPEPQLRQGTMVGLLRSGELAAILAAGAKLNELIHSPRPADRQLAAQTLGEGGVAGFYRPLLQLLADDQPQVQRAALVAAGHLQHPKLWPAVIQCLVTPPLRSTAIDALVAGGTSVLPALAALPQRSAPMGWGGHSEEQAIWSAIARICGRIGGEEAKTLLRRQLTYPNAQVRGAMLVALNRCDYRANALDQPFIYQQLEAEAAHAAWTLATLHDLDGLAAFDRVKAALRHDLAQQRIRIFGWLALLYEPTLMRQVQGALRRESDTDKQGYALEILHLSLPPALKGSLLPLLTDSATLEPLQQPALSVPDRLSVIINSGAEWVSPWLKVCALYVVGQTAMVELAEVVQGALADAAPVVRQAAAWAFVRLDNGGEPGMLMLVEKVICLKMVDFLAESGEEVLADVAALLEERHLKAGELLLAKGELDAALYLVVAGQVRLHDGERTISTLGEQESFGELSLFNPIPQPLSMSAVTEVQLLRLPQEALRQVLEEHSSIAWQILQRLAQRLQRVSGQGRAEQARADLLGGLREKLTRATER